MPLSSPAPVAATPQAIPHSTSVVLQTMAAIMLGLFVVGVAGFSQIDALHNASHDTRHSNAFPCH
jgi:cobalt transporter subunit CbtB